MIKTAELLGKQGGNDAIMSTLKQTLQEEERMSGWLMDNSSSILGYHWSKIEAMIRGKREERLEEKRRSLLPLLQQQRKKWKAYCK